MRYKFIILFLLIGFVSKAQVYQLMPQYGYSTYRMNFDSTIQIPTFCGVPKLGSNKINKGALAFDSCNNRFYFFNPKLQVWDTIKSADASLFVKYTDTAQMLSAYLRKTDTISLSNRIEGKIDSLKLSNDSVYARKNNQFVFQYMNDTATVVKAFVRNVESFTINRGQVVYIFGASGDKASVKLADNSGDITSARTLGFVREDIASGQTGWVTTQGQVGKLQLGAYNEGDILWLDSIPGGFTKTKPVAPRHSVFLGVVERANNGNGIAYVKPQNGYELGELHDVKITSPQTNEVLAYTTNIWENKNIYSIVDTTSLSNRINNKLNISDTSVMLSPYLRSIDTTNKYVTSVFRKTASDSVFFVKGGTNNFAFRDSAGGANIYNTDGTLTGNRTLSVSNNSLTFGGSANASSGISNPFRISPTLTATANNDLMSGLDINPTFSNGAFTGVQNTRLRLISATTGTAESLTLFNNNNTGGSGTSIRFRNNYTGVSRIWASINFTFPEGGGGELNFNTSNGLGLDATNKLQITRSNVISNANHIFAAGIAGGNVFIGTDTDPAVGIIKNLIVNRGGSAGGTQTISLAVANTSTHNANTNAFGLYLNNTATVSGTGQRFNISSVGTSLNHFAGNTLIGTTTNDASALLNVTSTTQGFLQPRMTTSQMNAISTPATGLSVFNTTDSAVYIRRGTGAGWQQVANEIIATGTLDFPNTLAQTSSDLTISLTGAIDGDAVVLGIPNAAMNANSNYTAWVSASGVVTVRFNNYGILAINPASATFKVTIIK